MAGPEQGRFCDNPDENGEICTALMEERSIFWYCPACKNVVYMDKAEVDEKLKREKIRSEFRPTISVSRGFAIDGEVLVARSRSHKGAQ